VGLFSSKKVINTGTAISPLLGEKPNLIRSAILKASFNDLPYVPSIVEALISGYNIDPRAFYAEGESGRYRLGLPQGNVPTIRIREPETQTVIANIEGLDVSDITYTATAFRQLTDNEIGLYILQTNSKYNYDRQQGTFDSGLIMTTGYIAEFVNAEVVVTSQGLSQGDIDEFNDLDLQAPTVQETRDVIITVNTFDPNDKENTISLLSFNVPIFPLVPELGQVSNYPNIRDFESNVIINRYAIPDGNGGTSRVLIFAYDYLTGIYPELNIYNEVDLKSPYFPIVPIRIDKQMVGDINHEQALYKNPDFIDEIDNILSDVGTSLESIQTALNDNPDVGDVDDAYIIFGIPFGSEHDGTIGRSSKDQATLKYLFNYFTYLHDDVQIVDKNRFDLSLAQGRPTGPEFNVIHIRDSELLQALYWNYITIEDVPWDAVGTGGRFNDKVYRQSGLLRNDPPATNEDFYSSSELHYYKYDDVAQTAVKITVSGIYIQNDVIRNKVVVNTLWDSFIVNADAPKDGFYIPVSFRTLQTLSNREANDVAFGSLILVVYALKVTKIKWYQKASFFKLLRIALFVVAIVTANPALLTFDLVVSEVALLIIESIIVNFLLGEALSIIFSILVDIIGVEAAAILAVVATLISGGQTFEILNLSASMPTAVEMLQIATALAGEINVEIGEQINELGQKTKDIMEEADKLQQEIDKVNEQFGLLDVGVDTNWLTPPLYKPESPDNFYSRTLTPNIGLASLDVIDYYYDNALSLIVTT